MWDVWIWRHKSIIIGEPLFKVVYWVMKPIIETDDLIKLLNHIN